MAKSRSPRVNTRTELAELRTVIEGLADQIQVLTTAVDELTEEVQWLNDNLRDSHHSLPPPFVLHSMPADPAAKDWKINQIRPDPAAVETVALVRPAKHSLFD